MDALPANRSWPPSCSHGTYQHEAITSQSRQLLMMGTWLPETCWATNRREKRIKKLHLVGFSYPHWIAMHGQPHIGFTDLPLHTLTVPPRTLTSASSATRHPTLFYFFTVHFNIIISSDPSPLSHKFYDSTYLNLKSFSRKGSQCDAQDFASPESIQQLSPL